MKLLLTFRLTWNVFITDMREYYVSNNVLFLVVLLYWHMIFGQFCKPIDCIDVKCYRVSTAKRGFYIYPNSTASPKVLITCQQTGDGGGGILYLHRFDGSVPFKKRWDDYIMAGQLKSSSTGKNL